MAALEVIADERRMAGQLHDLLRDVAPRVVLDVLAELGDVGVGRLGPDQHPVAAGARHRLHDQLVEPIEHHLSLVRVPKQVRVDVREQRLLVQVVPDEIRHEGVHRLVVRDSVADRVRDGDVAGPAAASSPGTPIIESRRNVTGSRYASSMRR